MYQVFQGAGFTDAWLRSGRTTRANRWLLWSGPRGSGAKLPAEDRRPSPAGLIGPSDHPGLVGYFTGH